MPTKKVPAFFWFISLFFCQFSLSAQTQTPPLIFSENEAKLYRIDSKLLYIEDAAANLSLPEVLNGNWQPAPENGLNFGFTASAFWVKLVLESRSDTEWLMEFGYPLIDHLDIYTADSTGNFQKTSYGDLLPFNNRPFLYRNLCVPLKLPPYQPQTLYLRMQTESSSQLPIVVQTKDTFVGRVIDDQIRYGLQIGMVIVMIFYNFFVFVVVRDRNYLLYVLAVFGNLSIVASVSGHMFQYILPDSPNFANQYLLFSLNLSTAANNLFAIYFLQTKKYSRWLAYLQWSYVGLGALMMISPFVVSYLFSAKISVLLTFSSTYVILSSSAWCWWRGNRTAAFFTLAWVSYLLGIQILGLKNYGILSSNFFTDHAAEIGNVLEVVLLSFAIGDRYRILREEKEVAQAETLKAQAATLNAQRELNEGLEEKVKARTKELSEALEELNHTNEELSITLDTTQQQQEVIQQKNKSITDSIQYARRIQQSILPTQEMFDQLFADSFILFRPRDIVSGDFFFLHREITSAGEPLIFLAVVDCTGHGVPGALMSMLGNEILQEIIVQAKVYAPDQILTQLHQKVRRTLRQQQTNVNDGMDASLVVIAPQQRTLTYAGARHPLVYVQAGAVKRIPGDRLSVGGHQHEGARSFTAHTLELDNQMTAFYLFSDGYQDQFGGQKKRKFMISRMLELFTEIHPIPFKNQQERLSQELDQWMLEGEERQIDDILVLGVQL